MRRNRWVVAALVCGLFVAGMGIAAGSNSAPAPVTCQIDANTLTCPLPAPETVTQTATVTSTVTQTVTAAPTTSAAPTTTTAPPAATTAPSAAGFPTEATTGVPAGWQPTTTRGSLTVTTAGAIVQDMRINGDLIINAANVTVRRVEIVGGSIENQSGSTCRNGLLIEDTTIKRGTAATTASGDPAVGTGGYTARRVKIDGLAEGFRAGGKPSCTAVVIENSWARIVRPDTCGDWHGDALQGYGGPAITVRNSYMELVESGGCGGTAPLFVPANQGNTSLVVDGLIVKGGGYPFRDGVAGTVKNLNIVNGSWGYGPVDVKCSVVTSWDAYKVDLDAGGQPVSRTAQACTGSGT